MIVIKKYLMLMPAQLAKLELGSHGIESTILDEVMGTFAPHLTMSAGIRLAVADEDEEQAEAILATMQERDSAALEHEANSPNHL